MYIREATRPAKSDNVISMHAIVAMDRKFNTCHGARVLTTAAEKVD